MPRFIAQLAAIAGIALASLSATPAAAMSLTLDGVAEGFTLSTFATGFPVLSGVGPLGIAFPGGGKVLVSDYPGFVRVFPTDTDGQAAGAVAPTFFYGGANAIDIRQSGTRFFMTQQAAGNLIEITPTGTPLPFLVTGMPAATGLTTNPNNGHLLVSTLGNGVIWDVDPATGIKTPFVFASADGLTATSTTLYAEVGGHIIGYDLGTAAVNFDSGFISGADGAAAGTGTLAGKVYVNTNFGEIWEVDVATTTKTKIAEGGSRGDFVSVDIYNGSLLLTQTDSIVRLTAPVGGGFGDVPEPASLALIGLGLAGLGVARRRKQ